MNWLVLVLLLHKAEMEVILDTRSGIKAWVDVDTPREEYTTVSSRGETWDLVMSDEFNVDNRNFSAGHVSIYIVIVSFYLYTC